MVHTWVSDILVRSCIFWKSISLVVPSLVDFLAMSSPLSVWFFHIRDLDRVPSGENSNAFTVFFKLSYCYFCCLILDAFICFLLEKIAFLLLFAFGFANSIGKDPVMLLNRLHKSYTTLLWKHHSINVCVSPGLHPH